VCDSATAQWGSNLLALRPLSISHIAAFCELTISLLIS